MILITGGAGYIGSHLALRLLRDGYDVIIYDNLSNSTMRNLSVIFKNTRSDKKFHFVNGDIRDELKFEKVFKLFPITKVVHLAGLKSVSDSFVYKQDYNNVNVMGSKIVLSTAVKYNVQTIIFSSSAAVYAPLPVGRYNENMSVSGTSSHYSHTKLETEKLMTKLKEQDMTIDMVILRYFNPVGTNSSGLLIEESIDTKNLFPNIVKHLNNDTCLEVFGDDYITFDGTAIRDYIHIDDLIDVHMLMINDFVLSFDVRVFNVGSDAGYSVREVINEFNNQIDQPLKFVYRPRRKGDVQMCIADISKIKKTFDWKPSKTLGDMVNSVLPDDMKLV